MIAVYTNILVHAHRKDASLHTEAGECVRSLAENAAPWAICFHSLIEFYGVVTHRKIWNRPSLPQEAADQIAAWRESPSVRVLVDAPEQIDSLMQLADASKVSGAMIHDARIANSCLSNGVRELWSVDRDFSRFPELKTKNPLV